MAKTEHIHEKRGITFQEYGALLATREMLASGTLKHTIDKGPEQGQHLFTMYIKGDRSTCGTIGCIGGTMAMIMGKLPGSYVDGSGCADLVRSGRACSVSLVKLFFPPEGMRGMSGELLPTSDGRVYPDHWNWITPEVAVKAIDNWLRTGDPGWHKLLPKKGKRQR